MTGAWDVAGRVAAGCGAALLVAVVVIAAAAFSIRWWFRHRKAAAAATSKAGSSGRPSQPSVGDLRETISRAIEASEATAAGEHEEIQRIRHRAEMLQAVENLPAAVKTFLQDAGVAISGWETAERDLAAVPGIVAGSVADARRRLAESIHGLFAGGAASSGLGTEHDVPAEPMAAAELGWRLALEEVQTLLGGEDTESGERLWRLFRTSAELIRAIPKDDPRWDDQPELHELITATREVFDTGPPSALTGEAAAVAQSKYSEAAAERAKALAMALEQAVRLLKMLPAPNPELAKARKVIVLLGETTLEGSKQFDETVRPYVRPQGPKDS